ncbi:hypothetical protein SNEBB_006892 [Seison nebaliae]|nr:hypothetical protein SNEBB_006892 [Seison nebaliae]
MDPSAEMPEDGYQEIGIKTEAEMEIRLLEDRLNRIVIAPPMNPPSIIKDPPTEVSERYKTNTPKEELVHKYVDNFKQQYEFLYPDRRPLLLTPVNECGIPKFVSLTIKGTIMPYIELESWSNAAAFVADFLNMEPLECVHDLPKKLFSPTYIINEQTGNCFDYSTLLVSILIAFGYDAYVVSGYASREICSMNGTRRIYEDSDDEIIEPEPKEVKKPVPRYLVKTMKNFQSKFLIEEQKREKKRKEQATLLKQQEADRMQELSEAPIPDPLKGLRIHSWVVVLQGKREIGETFFIEPFTGTSKTKDDLEYYGIESIWNDQNYWINMQDCTEGCSNLSFDLYDATKWEFMFPSDQHNQLALPSDEKKPFDNHDDDDDADDDAEFLRKERKKISLPNSWVDPLVITKKKFERRCPMGKKVEIYRRVKVEKYAPFLKRNGLVKRVLKYNDRECNELIYTKEKFENRADKMYKKEIDEKTGDVTDHFSPGRPKRLKKHKYNLSHPGPENDRHMWFYSNARLDGLKERVETPTTLVETYEERPDFLIERNITFDKRQKKFGPQEKGLSRPILKIIETYDRCLDYEANLDLKEAVFNIKRGKIELTYHRDENFISSSKRTFIKADDNNGKITFNDWSSDYCTHYQADSFIPPPKDYELYEMYMQSLEKEEEAIKVARRIEDEIRSILNERTLEEAAAELHVSIYDTERNEKAKKFREELARRETEERKRREIVQTDYLAPFLAQFGNPDKIDRKLAFDLKERCLADLKKRLIDKANLMQKRYEEVTLELQQRQANYQQTQLTMTKEEEEAYMNYCQQTMFQINILELRLARHKEMAPYEYMRLDQVLRKDTRLSQFFN